MAILFSNFLEILGGEIKHVSMYVWGPFKTLSNVSVIFTEEISWFIVLKKKIKSNEICM